MFRAVLKSVLARKLRLVLSGAAVVLGVMFVAGAMVLTTSLSNSFSALFTTVYQGVDVQVSAKPPASQQGGGTGGQSSPLPASVLSQVRAVDGVASAKGEILVNGAIPIGKDGKAILSATGQQYGANWDPDSTLHVLRSGHGPAAADEVAINATLAKSGNFKVGEQLPVLINGARHEFTIAGIYGYTGNRDSLAGETSIEFTTPVAQKLMLGRTGVYGDISVRAGQGVSQATLKTRIADALGSRYQVQTGDELAKKSSDAIKTALNFFNYILLGFAGVALFVGAFLILNTFSIIVAQRTQELALMRALGSSRRQVIGSVLLEAAVIGTLAGAVGLLAGIGVGSLLGYAFTHLGGGNLALSIGVPASAVIASFAVGILITLFAALFPSLRASRIPPIAAMRDAATPDRPLTRVTIIGGAVFVTGGVLLGLGLFANLSGTATLWAILAGVLIAFIGVALLTPVIARPVVSVIGRAFSFTISGKLGRRNSGRNPRRTAITAAALMVGIALITGISTVLSSVQASIAKVENQQIKADLIVSGQQTSEVPPTFDPTVLAKIRSIDGVGAVAGIYRDAGTINGKVAYLTATDDPRALASTMGLTRSSGTIGTLSAHQILVAKSTAKSQHLSVGDTVRVGLTGGTATYTVAGVYSGGAALGSYVLPHAAVSQFRFKSPVGAYVNVSSGASISSIKKQVNSLLADNPLITVVDRSSYIQQQTGTFDTVETMIQILLTLAIVIAALGVINTLVLSILERTRELGMLRAIGMRRRQLMGMITAESVTISVFGAVLGLAVGAGLGTAVVRALHDQGIKVLSFSWNLMIVYLVLAAIIGVVAAVLPSIRASRLNVLAAIAYE